MKIYFLFVFLVLLSQAYSTSPLDFVFNGECPSNYEYCLPYSKLSFRNELASFSDKQVLKRMNNFILNHPEFFLKAVEVYKIDEKPRNFGLKTLETIKKRESYLNFSLDYLISNDEINYTIMFPNLTMTEKLPKIPNFNKSYYQLGDNTDFLPDTFRFITNFLFHMYHLNESYIQDSLLGLPLDFNDAPLLSMTPPEFLLFKDLDVTLIRFRRNVLDSFKYYNSALEEYWTKSQRKLFFNNRLNISLDDFIFVYYVMKTRGASFNKQKKLILIPILHSTKYNGNIIRDFDERYFGQMIDFNYRLPWNDERNNTAGVEVFSDHLYEKNSSIYLNIKSGSSLELFFFNGMIPKTNPNDCFEHEFIENEKILKDMRLTLNKCIRVKDMKRVHLIANMISMNDQEINDCKQKIEKIEWNSNEFYEKMDKECLHPQWTKKNDPWIKAVNHLEENNERFEVMTTTALDYVNYRKSKSLPFENGKLIKEYMENRIHINEKFLKEIKELKKYGKKMQKESENRVTKTKTEL